MGPEKAREYAHKSLPYLVWRARQRRTIYYGELAEKVGLNAQGLGPALDYVRDELCVPRRLPHLSILVVRDDKAQMPPNEVMERSGMRPAESYRATFERLKGEVFAHEGWDRLLADLDLPTADGEYGGTRYEPKDG